MGILEDLAESKERAKKADITNQGVNGSGEMSAAVFGRLVNLHKIPGMTKDIAVQFQRDGVINKESFIELGIDGLIEYKGVGKKKAEKFIEAMS